MLNGDDDRGDDDDRTVGVRIELCETTRLLCTDRCLCMRWLSMLLCSDAFHQQLILWTFARSLVGFFQE